MATATLQPPQPLTVPVPPLAPLPTPALMPSRGPALTLYRMTNDLYERITEAGLLGAKDRVVLLDGFLVNQMSIGRRRSASVALGLASLQGAAPPEWYVRPEQPIVLRFGPDGDSAPQPDLVVAIGSILRYVDRHPVATEVGLVVEVATDLDVVRIDRLAVGRYAHAGIPIACIVNVTDRSIEVYSEPSGPSADPIYRSLVTLRAGQSLVGEIGNATTGPAALMPIPVESFFAPL